MTHTYETAIRPIGPIASPEQRNAAESAFRTLESRSASPAQWESLIARIQGNNLPMVEPADDELISQLRRRLVGLL